MRCCASWQGRNHGLQGAPSLATAQGKRGTRDLLKWALRNYCYQYFTPRLLLLQIDTPALASRRSMCLADSESGAALTPCVGRLLQYLPTSPRPASEQRQTKHRRQPLPAGRRHSRHSGRIKRLPELPLERRPRIGRWNTHLAPPPSLGPARRARPAKASWLLKY